MVRYHNFDIVFAEIPLREVLGEHYPNIRLTHRDILKDSLHK